MAELRPLAVADILANAFEIWWRQSWTLFAIVLVVTAPVEAVNNLVQILVFPDAYDAGSPLGFEPGSEPEIEWAAVRPLLAAGAIAGILGLVSYALAEAGCFKAVADSYLGIKPTWRGSLGFAFRRAHSVVWLAVLQSILLLFAFILLVVPAIWLGFAWSVAVPALLAEDVRGRRALGRSFRLVRGRWWRTAGIVILAVVIATFAAAIVSTPFSVIASVLAPDNPVGAVVASTVGATLGAIVATPLVAAFVTLVYFDLRARKEGPEIELAAR